MTLIKQICFYQLYLRKDYFSIVNELNPILCSRSPGFESRLRLDFSPPVTDIDMAIYNDKVYGMQNHVEFEIVKNVG